MSKDELRALLLQSLVDLKRKRDAMHNRPGVEQWNAMIATKEFELFALGEGR